MTTDTITAEDALTAQALTAYATACYARAQRRAPGRQAAIETTATRAAGDAALQRAHELLNPRSPETPWAAPRPDPDTIVECSFSAAGCEWRGRHVELADHLRGECRGAPF